MPKLNDNGINNVCKYTQKLSILQPYNHTINTIKHYALIYTLPFKTLQYLKKTSRTKKNRR